MESGKRLLNSTDTREGMVDLLSHVNYAVGTVPGHFLASFSYSRQIGDLMERNSRSGKKHSRVLLNKDKRECKSWNALH
jgi:hypothetical protein